MKKVAAVVLLMLVFAVACVSADQETEDELLFEAMHTSGLRNGIFLQQESSMFTVRQIEYINGIREAFANLGLSFFEQKFPGYTTGEILDELKSYYTDNPGMENRPVIEVVLLGCTAEGKFNVITKKMETKEYLNGFYLLSEDIDALPRMMYVQGLCDAAAKLDMQTMVKHYGEMDYPDIWDTLRVYYIKHAFERERAVVDVLLSGME
jgi:hypothetical protein